MIRVRLHLRLGLCSESHQDFCVVHPELLTHHLRHLHVQGQQLSQILSISYLPNEDNYVECTSYSYLC